jgi:CDP-diacylglycerol--glycerol-3-phosphate 3-phosphatidyltransferase
LNLPNKITTARIILSVIIIIILCFPYPDLNINEKILTIWGVEISLKYLVSGILFIIASLTDFLDGNIARKRGLVTNLGKMLDAIADKLLVDSVLIILAAQGQIHEIIPVVIVMRDIVVNAIKMQAASNGKVVAAIKSGKIKTAALMVGTVLVFFNNFPFSHFFAGARIAEFLLYFATLMSLISMIQYYVLNKNIITDTK